MLMLSLFSKLDFASLYEDRRTVGLSSQMKCISAYKIVLCVCKEFDFTKIATLIIFITHFSFIYGKNI